MASSDPAKIKVVLITNIPTPYRVPLFNILSEKFKRRGYNFKVIFYSILSRWRKMHSNWLKMKDRYSTFLDDINFEYRETKTYDFSIGYENIISLPVSLFSELYLLKPDIVITGGFSLNSIIALVYCKISRIPYIIFSGAIKKVTDKSFLRYFVRRILISQAAAYIVYGTRAKKYLIGMGAKLNKMFIAFNTINIKFYSSKENTSRITKDNNLAMSKENINIIYVGQLIKRKGLTNLLESLKFVEEKYNNFRLYLIGTGPLETSLKELSRDLKINRYIKFCGFKTIRELKKIYYQADLLILPSFFEIWGLVINEAMAVGIPVIASKYAGAVDDLIDDGINGFVVDPYNIQKLADAINTLIGNPKLRKNMGKNAKKKIVKRFTPEKSALGFLGAVEHVMRRRLCND